MRGRRWMLLGALTLVVGVLAVVVVGAAQGSSHRAGHRTAHRTGASEIPTARRFAGVSEIGTLYPNAGAPRHSCTASVVDSPGENTLITAAHCVRGTAAGLVFVPGEQGTRAPYGRWTVTSAYVDRRWVIRQDPRADVAFLTVAPQTIAGKRTEVQQVTGGYQLGAGASPGEEVRVIGYPAGHSDDAISCAVRVYLTHGYPSFDCHGYVGGTSGSPWLLRRGDTTRVVGIIGGLNQGGCVEYTSYSSPLSGRSRHTYTRAASGAQGDDVPRAGPDGC